ncbi:hypothetical protein U9M48_016237, partial [Paspalum notatum var. saurae]
MYKQLISIDVFVPNRFVWQLKVPLKIKIFIWLLFRGVILTKDNLIRRHWQGSKQYCFCSADETIQHLFFACPCAKFLWRIVSVTFGIHPPKNVTHMFGSWLHGVNKKIKNQILIGICALCWAIWLCRNDIIFDNHKEQSYMQILFKTTHFWVLLQKEEERDFVRKACCALETTTVEIFSKHGWMFSNRLLIDDVPVNSEAPV